VCADELARNAVRPGSPGLEEIRRVFGDNLVDALGNLDRKAMADIVFRDESQRKILESIIHPRVAEEKSRMLGILEAQGHSIVIVDVPLLYESDWQEHFDLVVVVYVPRRIQEQRLMDRDGISSEEARIRIKAQLSIEKKKELAHRLVDNADDVEHTCLQVKRLLEELRALALKKKQSEKTDGVSSRRSDGP